MTGILVQCHTEVLLEVHGSWCLNVEDFPVYSIQGRVNHIGPHMSSCTLCTELSLCSSYNQ